VTFLVAWRLWLLLVVAAMIAAYVLFQRRRAVYALRFSSAELLDSIAPRRPGVRRYVPAALFLLALVVLVMAFARPARDTRVPRERATVIIAIDVSLSMQATDVEPSRLEAAQAAADRFIDELPPTLNVGVLSFAGTAAVLVSPTQDHQAAKRAIDNLRLAESTAIGEAIFTALDALENAPADETGTAPPARIVLLSDGETTVGRPDGDAVAEAVASEVPVSTIAFGTDQGFILYDDPRTAAVESEPILVPVGDDNLRSIADGTGGSYFTATSLQELEEVYENIGSAVGYEEVSQEISEWFVAAGLVLLAVSSGFSLVWFQRLP
jgi:Ca-activated chloride channel family protein